MSEVDLLRVTNTVLSVVLVVITNYRIARDWPRWTRRERLVRVHLSAYLLWIAAGTIEAMAQDVPPGYRVLGVLVIHLSFLAALWRSRKDPVRNPERAAA